MAKKALPDLAVPLSLASFLLTGLLSCSAFFVCLVLSCTGLPFVKNSFLLPHLWSSLKCYLFLLFLKIPKPLLCPVLQTPLPCSILFSHSTCHFPIFYTVHCLCVYFMNLPVRMKAPGGYWCPLRSLRTIFGTVGINQYLMRDQKKPNVLGRCLTTILSYLYIALWSWQRLLNMLCHWFCTIK